MNRTPGFDSNPPHNHIETTNDKDDSRPTASEFQGEGLRRRSFHKSRHTWTDNLFTADMLDDLNFNFEKLGSGGSEDEKVGKSSTGLFDTMDAMKGPASALNPANDAVVGSSSHRRAESMSGKIGSGLMSRAFAFSNSLGNGVDIMPPPIAVSMGSKTDGSSSPSSPTLDMPVNRSKTYHPLGPVPIVEGNSSQPYSRAARSKTNRSIGSPSELDLDGIVEEHGRLHHLPDLSDSNSMHKRRVTFGGMQEFSTDIFSSGGEGFKLGAESAGGRNWGGGNPLGQHARASSSIAQGHPLYLGEQAPANPASQSNVSGPTLVPSPIGTGSSNGTPSSSPLSSPSPRPNPSNPAGSPTNGAGQPPGYFEPKQRTGAPHPNPADWNTGEHTKWEDPNGHYGFGQGFPRGKQPDPSFGYSRPGADGMGVSPMMNHQSMQHLPQQQFMQQQLAAQYAMMQQYMASQGKPVHAGNMYSPDVMMQMAMAQPYAVPPPSVHMGAAPPPMAQHGHMMGGHRHNSYPGSGKQYSPKRGPYVGRNKGGYAYGGYQQQGGKHRNSQEAASLSNVCESLMEYKTSGRRPGMAELSGHVVEFSRDAHGSRFIQYKMETAPEHEKQQLIDEVLGEAVSLMQDTFGNYVIQNFLEHGTEAQRVALSNTMCGSMYALSAQAHGCRVVQRAFDLLETNLPQRNKLLQELLLPHGHVAKCSKNSHATHVLQKAVNILISEARSRDPAVAALARKTFDNVRSARQLLDAVEQAVHDSFDSLAMHAHAYRLVLSVLGNCSPELSPWVAKMLQKIEPLQMNLATDQHGNFILQHILDVGSAKQQDNVQSFVNQHILELSQHKFGSHLVEKCLDCSNVAQSERMIAEMLNPTGANLAQAKRASTTGKLRSQLTQENGGGLQSASALVIMMQDPYANFVVQKAFDKSSGIQRSELAREILSRSETLSKFTYGRHILSHINREGGADLITTAN